MAASALVVWGCNGKDVTRSIPEVPDDPDTPAVGAVDSGIAPVAEVPHGPVDSGLTPVTANTDPVRMTPDPDAGLPPVAALDCSALPAAPVEFETLEGFTGSEDFVFDALGNYVGVDNDLNLVRISKSGEKQLWAPRIGATAGMGILPDGSIIFCDTTLGALQRVYPNGSMVVVLGGLLYPNGMDIGPDGFVYVAENGAGRVRRVNPDTGEFSIVAMGLDGPNGVAFSNDPSLLYIGSFEGSGVYKVQLSDPRELGVASVFARPNGSTLREPRIACPDQQVDLDCHAGNYLAGKCQAFANVVDCMPIDPCPGLEENAVCDYPYYGSCRSGRCVEACTGLQEGDACEDLNSGIGPGMCRELDDHLYCIPPNACDGLTAGAPCEDEFAGGIGSCLDSGGLLYCSPPNPCDGLSAGDACVEPSFGAGSCVAYDFDDQLYCQPPNVCDGLSEGAVCEDPFVGSGTCIAYETNLYCTAPNPCDGLTVDAPCEDPFNGPGVCQAYDGLMYCAPPGPCFGLSEGAACEDPFVSTGVCSSFEGSLYCTVECDGSHVGGICIEPTGVGYCGTRGCELPSPGGGIDGMGVDACGNVYASEYTEGNIWRISPEGEIELLVQLPSSWIPNIKWGRDVGGFSSEVMYVANRDGSGLFGVAVGVPGVTEFYALSP